MMLVLWDSCKYFLWATCLAAFNLTLATFYSLCTIQFQLSSLHSVGFLVGFVLASILMSVVGSAVNTVIVCFAESPAEFEVNHPQLSAEMRAAWRSAWPVECANY